jgi:hypothetical protein
MKRSAKKSAPKKRSSAKKSAPKKRSSAKKSAPKKRSSAKKSAPKKKRSAKKQSGGAKKTKKTKKASSGKKRSLSPALVEFARLREAIIKKKGVKFPEALKIASKMKKEIEAKEPGLSMKEIVDKAIAKL